MRLGPLSPKKNRETVEDEGRAMAAIPFEGEGARKASVLSSILAICDPALAEPA